MGIINVALKSAISSVVSAYNYVTGTQLGNTFDGFNVKKFVKYKVSYVQSEIPDGSDAVVGELCLVTGVSPTIYEFTSSWASLATIEDGERIVFFSSGADTTEPGYSATKKIYTWDSSEGTFSEYSLVKNDIFFLESESLQYRFDGTTCLRHPSRPAGSSIRELPISEMRCSRYFWGPEISADYLENVAWASSDPSPNGEYAWLNFSADPGVYELVFWVRKNSSYGIGTVYVDSVEQGSFNSYNATDLYNIPISVFIEVLTEGDHELKIVWSKDPSSSNYWQRICKICLKEIIPGWEYVWSHGQSTNGSLDTSVVVSGNAIAKAHAPSLPLGEYFLQYPSAQGDRTRTRPIKLRKGKYRVTLDVLKSWDCGIVTVSEGTNVLDTFNTYSDGLYNQTKTIDFVVDENRDTYIDMNILSKDALSSGYNFCLIYGKIKRLE